MSGPVQAPRCGLSRGYADAPAGACSRCDEWPDQPPGLVLILPERFIALLAAQTVGPRALCLALMAVSCFRACFTFWST